MAEDDNAFCKKVIDGINAAIASSGAARLTEDQYAYVRSQKEAIVELCRQGRRDEALEVEKRAMSVVQAGPPDGE